MIIPNHPSTSDLDLVMDKQPEHLWRRRQEEGGRGYWRYRPLGPPGAWNAWIRGTVLEPLAHTRVPIKARLGELDGRWLNCHDPDRIVVEEDDYTDVPADESEGSKKDKKNLIKTSYHYYV